MQESLLLSSQFTTGKSVEYMFRSRTVNAERCPRCAKRGVESTIKVFNIQNRSIKFCSDKSCFYPLDLDDGTDASQSMDINEYEVAEISDDSDVEIAERNIFDTLNMQRRALRKTVNHAEEQDDGVVFTGRSKVEQQVAEVTSDDSVQEMFTEIEDIDVECDKKAGDCVKSSEEAKPNSHSDDSVQEMFTEIEDIVVDCGKEGHDCANKPSKESKPNSNTDEGFDLLAEIGCSEETFESVLRDNIAPRLVDNQELLSADMELEQDVEFLESQQSRHISLEQTPESSGSSCKVFQEENQLLQMLLNIGASDDETLLGDSSELSSSTTSEGSSVISSSESHPMLPQWKNKNNMCWLDVTLSLLLMSPLRPLILDTLKESPVAAAKGQSKWLDSLLQDTFKEYHKVIRRVKRLQSLVINPQLTEAAKLGYRRVKARLERIRSHSLEYLQQHCNIGHDNSGDSPVFALSALLRKQSSLRPLFDSATRYRLECSACFHLSCSLRENPIVCLVQRPPADFRLTDEGFTLDSKTCENCQRTDQAMRVHWSRLNRFLLVQFCQGLDTARSCDQWCDRLAFQVRDTRYEAVGAVQYKALSKKTKHFVAWIRAPDSDLWLEADDMKERFCIFDKRSLGFPASELHLLLFMAFPRDPGSAPTFPLLLDQLPDCLPLPPDNVTQDAPASAPDEEEVQEVHSEEEAVVADTVGLSFASIASAHMRLKKPKARTKRSEGGVKLKRLRISLRRCDDS